MSAQTPNPVPTPGLDPTDRALAQVALDALVQTDANDEPTAGLIEDLRSTPISDNQAAVDVHDEHRDIWIEGFAVRKMVTTEAENPDASSQRLQNELACRRKALELFAKSKGLASLSDSSPRHQHLVKTIRNVIADYPAVLADLTEGPLLGAPSRLELETASKNLEEAAASLQEAGEESRRLGEENDDLRQQLAETQQALSEAIHQPHFEDQDVETVASTIGKSHSAILTLVFSVMGAEVQFDWVQMENIMSQAFTQAREYTHRDIQTSTKWLARFNNLSTPACGTFSVRELAASILASAFTTSFSFALGMGHLHALAKQMEICTIDELCLPLALLLSWFKIKRDKMIVNSIQVSINRALIFLRGLELYCDHVVRPRQLSIIETIWDEVQPLLKQACPKSIIVRALNEFVGRKLGNPESSLSPILVAEAEKIASLNSNNSMFFMDMGCFVAIKDSIVHIGWPNEANVQIDIPEGWYIQIDVDGQPLWKSSYFPIGADSITNLQAVIPALLGRRLTAQAPVIVTEPIRLIHDY